MTTARWLQIGHSWLSLKTWVKLWLFWLNLVLFGSIFFLNDPLGQYTLLSLIPTVAIILFVAYRYGGLVRLLGVGHLIPWIPLLAYLELRILTNWVGTRIAFTERPGLFLWAILLEISLTLCLGFDLYDVVRWYRGEQFILGTEAAFRAKASKRSKYLARL